MKNKICVHFMFISIIFSFSAGATKTRTTVRKTKSHDVMISYSWSDKNTVDQIRAHIKKAGLTYWIDKEKMSGCTLEAMSYAVENCSIFLMCYSKKYFESGPCRDGKPPIKKKLMCFRLYM